MFLNKGGSRIFEIDIPFDEMSAQEGLKQIDFKSFTLIQKNDRNNVREILREKSGEQRK